MLTISYKEKFSQNLHFSLVNGVMNMFQEADLNQNSV